MSSGGGSLQAQTHASALGGGEAPFLAACEVTRGKVGEGRGC